MRILVGMSGGVDSASAVIMLKKAGHDVEGAFLIMHEHGEIEAARECAHSIGVTLHEIDCRDSFGKIVKRNFVDEYTSGRTPNPCIICNERVKFFELHRYAVSHGFDAIATGHYAGIREIDAKGGKRYALACAEDAKKDQTYMLYRLPQSILSKLILPLSDGVKEDIRTLARSEGISAADRPDSQEICFLPNGGHAEYVESVAGKSPEGDFLSPDGRVLGRHKGIIRYTVGQRKGLGISLGERAFVTKIDPENNTVTLSSDVSGVSDITVTDAVFSGIEKPSCGEKMQVLVKVRYTAPKTPAVAEFSSDDGFVLHFDEPIKCAPGQSAVLYKDGVVLCGGIIN